MSRDAPDHAQEHMDDPSHASPWERCIELAGAAAQAAARVGSGGETFDLPGPTGRDWCIRTSPPHLVRRRTPGAAGEPQPTAAELDTLRRALLQFVAARDLPILQRFTVRLELAAEAVAERRDDLDRDLQAALEALCTDLALVAGTLDARACEQPGDREFDGP